MKQKRIYLTSILISSASLTLANPVLLDDQFILIVDDWNWENVRNGTLRGLNKNNMKIIYKYELYTNDNNHHSTLAFKYSLWHNGLVALVIQK